MKNKCLKIGMLGSIIGCIMVSFDFAFETNILWVLLNPFMAIHNWRIKEYGQFTLWSSYVIIALYGVIRHLYGG